MKSKIISVTIFIIIIYMLAPIGDYGVNDIVYKSSYTKSFYNFNKNKFTSDVIQSIYPEVNGILFPLTSVTRDGVEHKDELVRFMNGENYNRKVGGGSHRAIDAKVGELGKIMNIGRCPVDSSKCADVCSISPISGVLVSCTSFNGVESIHWNKPGSSTPGVIIDGTGEFKGIRVRIYHLSNIPSFKVGDSINQGDYIGTQCNLGDSTTSHVHLDVSLGNNDSKEKGKVDTWFNRLVLHSSLGTVVDDMSTEDKTAKGWSESEFNDLISKSRYNNSINIPNEFKY